MKVAILNVYTKSSAAVLTALPESGLIDREFYYITDIEKGYVYKSLAVNGAFQPDDTSGGTGFWVESTALLIKGCGYIVPDSYDFAGNSATDITSAANLLILENLSNNNIFTSEHESKLDNIEDGATANSSDSHLVDRANHTGTQSASTITGAKTAGFISNFLETVRATILTGISFASSVAVVAGDSVLVALGKLQAQINAINATISRLTTYHPPNPMNPYVAGVGATLTLTADRRGMYFGLEGNQDDYIVKNLSMFDAVSNLHYDGCNIQATAFYVLESGFTINGRTVNLAVDYLFAKDGTNYHDNAGSTISTGAFSITGKSANLVYSKVVGNISGASNSPMLRVRDLRNGTGAGSDSFSGEARIIGWLFKRV